MGQFPDVDEVIKPMASPKNIDVEELMEAISAGMGGAEVKYMGFEPPRPPQKRPVSEKLRSETKHEKTQKAPDPAPKAYINNKKQRKLQLLLEYKGHKVAMASDGTVWFLDENKWHLMTEALYPDIPQGG